MRDHTDGESKTRTSENGSTATMPSLRHECCVDMIEELIMNGLNKATRRLRTRAGLKVAAELGRVFKTRSAAVSLFKAHYSRRRKVLYKREPDASFTHPAQPNAPCLVVEVCRHHLCQRCSSF
jgi:hypothetical protein